MRVLAYVLISMGFGVVTELGALLLKLWVYRRPQTPVFNIIVVFGLAMGSIAMLVPRYGMRTAFVAGFAVGLAYEIANLAFLKLWEFPGERLGVIHGRAAIVLVMGLCWGVLPILTAKVHAALPRTQHASVPPQSKLEQLNNRERALIEKLDGLRQREHEIESRLDEVRRRKDLVLDKQAGRKVERHTARPAPPP